MRKHRRKHFYLGEKEKGFKVPTIIHKRGLQYFLVDKYPNYWLYVHYYEGKGCFYECFDLHDLKCVERYGDS